MSIGYSKDKASIDGMLGDTAMNLNRAFRRGVQLGTELTAYSDAALTGAGYTAGELTTLRAMVNDVNQLNSIYMGAVTLGAVKDFRLNLRPLWGVLGDI